ncbi:coiled-coil domain-containing protein [Raineya orbicola]|jgi:hypothetical protein|uniref:Uncharacterized protein n=1 Tax=Raineya orbicola TaxID=2016530 RepID=A0A2N3IHD8_9BACT|nr:hypothetical protein [Raineya orbicola]PKQ69739.1 hypothetical protein Rain11_1194 [Raineya orbicola]
MISKIAIFNSKKHAKAVITLDKSSIQLVGENQIGKTTLIDTLNFLYCIKQQYMSFDNDKYNFKQTLDHLFPSDKNSYIVFENFKRKAGGYYCILLKRKIDELEYYKIDAPFDELTFFEENGKIKDFQTFIDYLLSNGINYRKLDKAKLFDEFYSFDQSKNAVVWLKNEVQRKEMFAEIYQHLINSKSINAESLQKALIIANNRKNVVLKVFADNTKKDSLVQLRKIHQDIELFKSIKEDFEAFKDCMVRFELQKEKIGQLFYTFNEYFNKRTQELELQIKHAEEQADMYEKLNEKIESDRDKLLKETQKLENEVSNKKEAIEKSEIVLREIALLNPLNLPTESLIKNFEERIENLNKQIDELNYYLQNITKNQLSEAQIRNKLADSEKKKESLITNIEGKERLLLFNITQDVEKQKLLNALLSQDVLDKGKLVKQITNFTDLLKIFDGEIDISAISPKQIKTLTELQDELEQTENEISELKKALPYSIDFEKKKNELQSKINEKECEIKKIEKVKLKEPNENNIKVLSTELESLNKQLDEKNKAFETIEKQIKDNKYLIKNHNQQKAKYEKELEKLVENNKIFAEEKLPELVCNYIPISDLELFLTDFRKQIHDYKELERIKNSLFNDLKNKSGREYAYEKDFIENVGKELEAIAEREKQKQEHLKIISNQIIHPVLAYLKEYKEFKRDFISEFNNWVRKYPISRIKEMTIKIIDNESFIKELTLISKVEKLNIGQTQELIFDTNDQEQQQGLQKLDEYLNSAKSRVYEFEELFSIKIDALYEDGSKKEIDLKKQNESTGTIRMINLILFLLIIKYFKVDSEENKVVFFVDELTIDPKNIGELVQFCKDNGFITIFAANIMGYGFEKYYFMRPSPENKGKVVLDETHTGKTRKYND